MASNAARRIPDVAMSDAQRCAIFAAMTERGLNIDDVRALCPNRSISRLTFQEAGIVLNRLNAGTAYAHPRQRQHSPRRPKGVYRIATDAQRRKIESLRIQLGWTPEGLAEFLSERRYADGRKMSRVDSSGDASSVIELLKGVGVRKEQGRQRQARAAASEPSLAAGSD